MKKLAPIVTVAALLFADRSQASNTEMDRETLVGLDGVFVLVEEIGDDERAAGMDREKLQRVAEQALTFTGVRVLTRDERRASGRRATLYLNVNVLSNDDRTLFAYNISVSLQQTAWIDATPKINVIGASTWSTETLGIAGKGAIQKSL